MDEIPEYSKVIINAIDSRFVDYDVLEIINEYQAKAHDRHIEVQLHGIQKVEIVASRH